FGFERGVSRSFGEAPVFHTIFSGLIVLGALVAMLPGLPIVDLILNVQVVNGLVLPAILVSILALVNDPSIMGEYRNGPVYNVVAGPAGVRVVALSRAMLVLAVLQTRGMGSGDAAALSAATAEQAGHGPEGGGGGAGRGLDGAGRRGEVPAGDR